MPPPILSGQQVTASSHSSGLVGGRRLRLAIVVNSFPTVSETFIYNKVAGLSERGVLVTVIKHASGSDEALYRDRLKTLNLRQQFARGVPASLKGAANFSLLVREPRRAFQALALAASGPRRGGASLSVIMGALAARRCDIVHFEFSGLGVAYLPVLDLLRPAKIFVSCRGAAEQIKPLLDPLRRSDLERLFNRADRVHCVSQDMLNCCTQYGLPERKAFVNRPAVRTDAFMRTAAIPSPTRPAGPVRICSTGRLHWKKGFEFALIAVKLLKDAGEAVTWEIIGDGPEREKLVYMVHTLGLSQIVTLTGRLGSGQVKERLQDCDIFLLPSLSEGISNAALEAMAMELPVISTRAGGMEEVITDGQNGFLVDCYDPVQIADRIRRVRDDISLRNTLGKTARETILSGFSIDRQITTFVSEYRSAVGGTGDGRTQRAP